MVSVRKMSYISKKKTMYCLTVEEFGSISNSGSYLHDTGTTVRGRFRKKEEEEVETTKNNGVM